MASSTNGTAPAGVKATYASPTGSQTFEQSITAPTPRDTKSKVAYLNELRSSAKKLQDEVNAFLTAKMEADKAQTTAADNGTSTMTNAPRDEEEEENYGEEKVEED